jgi:hypothetical protein
VIDILDIVLHRLAASPIFPKGRVALLRDCLATTARQSRSRRSFQATFRQQLQPANTDPKGRAIWQQRWRQETPGVPAVPSLLWCCQLVVLEAVDSDPVRNTRILQCISSVEYQDMQNAAVAVSYAGLGPGPPDDARLALTQPEMTPSPGPAR